MAAPDLRRIVVRQLVALHRILFPADARLGALLLTLPDHLDDFFKPFQIDRQRPTKMDQNRHVKGLWEAGAGQDDG
jgi:hypothetical protein